MGRGVVDWVGVVVFLVMSRPKLGDAIVDFSILQQI
jgi:hypothetical protein